MGEGEGGEKDEAKQLVENSIEEWVGRLEVDGSNLTLQTVFGILRRNPSGFVELAKLAAGKSKVDFEMVETIVANMGYELVYSDYASEGGVISERNPASWVWEDDKWKLYLSGQLKDADPQEVVREVAHELVASDLLRAYPDKDFPSVVVGNKEVAEKLGYGGSLRVNHVGDVIFAAMENSFR